MPPKPTRRPITDQGLQLVAQRFKVLSEPVRLKLLTILETGDHNVGQLVALTGQSQANVSKHLATLVAAGILGRRKQGASAFYFIADAQILQLCDLMCRHLEQQFSERKSPFG